MNKEINRSIEADAARFRWLLSGNGYFLEENFLNGGPSQKDQDHVREMIDEEMIEEGVEEIFDSPLIVQLDFLWTDNDYNKVEE